MSEQFTIHRAAVGPGWPFGASAVAAGSALLGGLAGLVTPMAALDWLAYQSYLDQITGLTPPLGTMAKLAFAALLAALLGGIGYAVARWAGVRSTGGFADLLARLRGARAGDEDDAPRLRGADRHPDAPARRPLSANRDLDVERAGGGRGAVPVFNDPDDDDDEDELLLISPMAAEMPLRDPAPFPSAAPPVMMPVTPVLPLRDIAAQPVTSDDADAVDWPDEDNGVDIPAPHADDWLTAPAPAPMPSASLSELRQADVRLPMAADELAGPQLVPVTPPPSPAFASEFSRMRAVPPPPLDLSVARLDELIARVETGMMRRTAAPGVVPPVEVPSVDVAAPAPEAPTFSVPTSIPAPAVAVAEPVTDAADPSFPHDPALAAALATLRRMAAA